jgi:Protein of unknown function (DUF998)
MLRDWSPITLIAGLISLFLAAGIAIFASRRPGYRHLRHTISELGETNAPDARLVSLGLFLPVGVALLGIAGFVFFAAAPHSLTGALSGLAACIGAGYAGAALFPCDPGSPLSGSVRQQIHTLAGAVEYIGGAASLATMGRIDVPIPALGGAAVPWDILAGVVLVSGVALSLEALQRWRGLIQRIAEVVLFGGLVLITLAWAQ